MRALRVAGIGVLVAVLLAGAWMIIETAGAVWIKAGDTRPDARFERRVPEYLRANPEEIVEVVGRVETRAEETELAEVQAVVRLLADHVFRDPDSPVGGNPEGDVSLVEFFDYNCPYCRRVTPTLIEIERTDPNLRIVYKEWPILGPNSEFAARAALAARNQGKYLEFHKAMMLEKGLMDEFKVLEVAGKIGLDVGRLEKDMEAPNIGAAIKRNNDLAQALRITGTPGFVIGEEILRGAASSEVIQDLIRRAREK